MKTAMQNHIADMKKIQEMVKSKNLDKDLEVTIWKSIEECIENAKSFLETEKEQIKNSYGAGAMDATREEVLQVENDGWISVNEKPKTFQEVILYREDAGVFVGYYGNLAESLSEMALENHYNNEVSEETMWKEQFFYFGLEGNGILEGSEEPTYWMPLPEPPKF